jgi:hypothetical protein
VSLDKGASAHDKKGDPHALCQVDQAGRCSLIDDVGSIVKGVEVLIDMRGDLNCLFNHLLENPMLCAIEVNISSRHLKRRRW